MKYLFTFILLLFCLPVFADNNEKETQEYLRLKNQPASAFFGMSFANSVPQNDLYTNIRNAGIGFSIYGGGIFSDMPLSMGGGLDMLFFDSKTRYFSNYEHGWFRGEDTVEAQTIVLPLTFFVRLQPTTGWIMPYIEGFAGANFFITSADYMPYYGEEDSKSKFSASWAYGLGAGFMIKITDIIEMPDSKSTIWLDLRMKYAFGTNAKYSTVRINDDSSVDFSTFKSETDMIETLIGVVFSF